MRQIWRQGRVAIYSQTHEMHSTPSAYEVIIVRKGKAHPHDKDQSPKEIYPSGEEWGTYGWTSTTLERAKERAQAILRQS